MLSAEMLTPKAPPEPRVPSTIGVGASNCSERRSLYSTSVRKLIASVMS